MVNERLRQNLRESVERSNSASKHNAELHSKVNLIRERNNSVSAQCQTHRVDRNRNQYESLKQTYESLTDRLSQLVTVDQQSRMTHQHGSS